MPRPAGIAEDLVTFEQFCALVPDGQKADLIDGVIFMASPDMLRSDQITNFVHRLLANFIEIRGLAGQVVGSRFAFKLSETRAPEPDAAYISADRMHLIQEQHMVGGPDIAVEVVAHESRHRDYGEKRQLYEEADVAEYWIIDPIQDRVEFLRLRDGKYPIVPLEKNNIFRSQALPGFWLNVNWLLAYPLPNSHHCLQEILAS